MRQYTLSWGACLLSLTGLAQVQPEIALRLDFNAPLNRYEVFAKPNFTAQRFTWGPSQISIVLPKEVADATISPHSNVAGVWLDQSTVYNPAAAPDRDYHGFTTQGGKADLTAGVEQLIFDFTLPKGFLEGVRLFDMAKDPGSAGKGMKGGDFVSYITNAKGYVRLIIDSRQAQLPVVEKGTAGSVDGDASVNVVTYPNPTTTNTIRLHLKGFKTNEVVRVQMTNLSGKLLKGFDESVETLAGRALQIPAAGDPYMFITVVRTQKKEQFSCKVWLNY